MTTFRRVFVALCLVLTTYAQFLLQNSTDLQKWSYYNGSEFPGAAGNLTWSTNNYALLTYDFIQRPTSPSPFNPQYISANLNGITPYANSTALSLDYRCENSSLVVRFIDSTLQTFQYNIPTSSLQLESSSTGGSWAYGVQVPIQSYPSFWGGAGDGVFHAPLKGISILAQGQGVNKTGTLAFTNLKLVPLITSIDLPLNSPSEVVPASTGTLTERMGVNIHFTNDDLALDIIQGAGFHWIRMDFLWGAIENPVGTYNFQSYDGLVTAAEQRGLRTLAILDYGHQYWTGGYMNPPVNDTTVNAFGNFAFETVKHYIGRNVTFEVWNEPDIPGFWAGNPNSTQYALMLKKALSRAREASTTAEILTGGMSSPPPGYPFWTVIESMSASVGASGLGTHLYVNPGAIPEGRWADIVRLGPIAQRLTSGGRLWCTEWGFSTTFYSPTSDGHEPIGRQLQAQMAVRQMILGWWANLPMLIYYDIRDDGTDPANSENNFGLIENNYTDKPSMAAVRRLFAHASGKQFVGLLKWPQTVNGLHVALWESTKEKTYVAWLEGAGAQNISLTIPVVQSENLTVTSFLGVTVTPTVTSNTATIGVNTGPIYITVQKPTTSTASSTTSSTPTTTSTPSSSTSSTPTTTNTPSTSTTSSTTSTSSAPTTTSSAVTTPTPFTGSSSTLTLSLLFITVMLLLLL